MKKFNVFFEGGECKDGMHGCNYLMCNCLDRDGDEVELYAEYLIPDDEDEIKDFLLDGCAIDDYNEDHGERTFDMDKFDKVSYQELKDEIIEQAKEENVDIETLIFEYEV